jgi:urea carboxylase-associated protein 2
MTTATPRGAQAHARAMADTVVETMATFPAAAFPAVPDGIDAATLTWAETVAGGGYTSLYLDRGDTVRLTDLHGDACAHLLAYNALQPVERLNVADTIKVQWQAYLSSGAVLLSDLGRALATITADTSSRHDTLCGTSTRIGNTAKYGDGAAQSPSPAGRELFKLAAAKHGLDARDVPPSLSFFQAVRADSSGALSFIGSAGAGCYVEITAELPLLVLVANTAHPLDPRPDYSCGALQVLARRGESEALERSPEMARALLNTAAYLTMRGAGAGPR